MSLRAYYSLAKPGLIYGNLLSVAGGFAVGSRGEFNLPFFLLTVAGMACVMGAACAFNNIIDRDIDPKMARTKDRALISGELSAGQAATFAVLAALIGFILLSLVNALVILVAAFGFFSYVILYSMFFKRGGPIGTFIGSLAGATPPSAGYAAAAGRLDLAALILFATLIAWQMAHFFSIALRRLDDYARAEIPVLPVVYGSARTKRAILVYIIAFTLIAPSLAFIGAAGRLYFWLTALSGLGWLVAALVGVRQKNETAWARRSFLASLIVLLVFTGALVLEGLTRLY